MITFRSIRNRGLWLPLLVASCILHASDAAGQQVTREEYALRRSRIIQAMDSNSIAIFPAATLKHRNGDVEYRFRQDDNLLYLTGFPEERSALVLTKRGIVVDKIETNEILFVRESDPVFAIWTGASYGREEAGRRFGFALVKHIGDLRKLVDSLLPSMRTLYYSPGANPVIRDAVSGFQFPYDKELKKDLTQRFPQLKIRNGSGLVATLRQEKSEAEIALLQKAIDATVTAHVEAMKSCKPGMFEYELQAIIEYCFTRAGAEYQGFPSIIGSGPNSTILHYDRNRREMQDGDLVVMDIGAEYQGYSADVTRTIPVNGKFNSAQREVYSIVLKAQVEGIKQLKPGVRTDEAHEAARKVIEQAGFGKYFNHGSSHPIGLGVHDVGGFGLLKAGMIVTMEPGIYIPEGSEIDKKYWNIGVRIEDDVLITDGGNVVLSGNAPRGIEEIERLMQKNGLGDVPLGGK